MSSSSPRLFSLFLSRDITAPLISSDASRQHLGSWLDVWRSKLAIIRLVRLLNTDGVSKKIHCLLLSH